MCVDYFFVFAFVLICMCFSSLKKLDWTPADVRDAFMFRPLEIQTADKILTNGASDNCLF